jgi:hypothetical protein
MLEAMRLLVLGLAMVLVWGPGCSRQRTSVAVDAALLTQVPADTVALGGMRVKALRGTAAWKKLLEQPGVKAQLDRLAAETSFDARKDLWEILWSTNGRDGLVYARGEFAPMGLEPKIEREGVQRMSYRGSMLLGNEENAVWFVNSSTAVYGKTGKLRELIDGRDRGNAGPSAGIRERIAGIAPGAHFWLVAEGGALPKVPEPGAAGPGGGMAMNFLQNLPKLMARVRMVTGEMSLVDGMAMELVAYCDGEAGARQVHDSLKGLVGLARIALPERQRGAILPLLDAVEVSQKDSVTAMKARATVEQFEKLQAVMGPVAGRGKAAD